MNIFELCLKTLWFFTVCLFTVCQKTEPSFNLLLVSKSASRVYLGLERMTRWICDRSNHWKICWFVSPFPERKYRKLLSQFGIFMKSITKPLLFTAILPSSFNYISLELALQKLHSSTSHLGSLRALSLQCFNRVAQICQKLKIQKDYYPPKILDFFVIISKISKKLKTGPPTLSSG